jgi:activator of HSP90 ATPase
MNTPENPFPSPSLVSRRTALAGIAAALGGMAAGSRLLADAAPPKDASPPTGNEKKTSIHQEIDIAADPQRVYQCLLVTEQFAAFSGRPARIDAQEGGAFTLFEGWIVGRNIELIPGERVVQAWRPTHWNAGIYSIARFELKTVGRATKIIFDHTGFPEGDYDSLLSGWNGHYWDPLAKFLA